MGKHSEIIGSFVRCGKFPIEADYIWDSADALNSFYAKPENAAIVHKGLLKVVANAGGQAIYWAVDKGGYFVFEKLIEVSPSTMTQDDLIAKLQEILGTSDKSVIGDEYDSILDLANKIKEIELGVVEQARVNISVAALIDYLVGGDDVEDHKIELIKEKLKSLDYGSLKKINDWIKQVDPSVLYSGLDKTKSLVEHFNNLWVKIMGNPVPPEKFRTMRDFQLNIERLDRSDKNFSNELNMLFEGIGFSAFTGLVFPSETKHIKSAKSIVAALAILDSLVSEAKESKSYSFKRSSTIDMESRELENNEVWVEGQVRVSEYSDPEHGGNIISIREDGLYANVGMDLSNGVLTLYVNGKQAKTVNIKTDSILREAKYEESSQSLLFIFDKNDGDTEEIRIPVSSFVKHWSVDNSGVNKVVELTKAHPEGGAEDKLSADVRLFNGDGNTIVKRGNTLYGDPKSSVYTHNGQSLKDYLDEQKSQVDTHGKAIAKINNDIAEIENPKSIAIILRPNVSGSSSGIAVDLAEDPSFINLFSYRKGRNKYFSEEVNVAYPYNTKANTTINDWSESIPKLGEYVPYFFSGAYNGAPHSLLVSVKRRSANTGNVSHKLKMLVEVYQNGVKQTSVSKVDLIAICDNNTPAVVNHVNMKPNSDHIGAVTIKNDGEVFSGFCVARLFIEGKCYYSNLVSFSCVNLQNPVAVNGGNSTTSVQSETNVYDLGGIVLVKSKEEVSDDSFYQFGDKSSTLLSVKSSGFELLSSGVNKIPTKVGSCILEYYYDKTALSQGISNVLGLFD